MSNHTRKAPCHPDRLHWAKGLCARCYAAQHHAANRESRLAKMRDYNRDVRHDRRKRRPASCHVDRAHFALGLCEQCYHQSAHAKALRRARYAARAGATAGGESYPIQLAISPRPDRARPGLVVVVPAKSASSFLRRPK